MDNRRKLDTLPPSRRAQPSKPATDERPLELLDRQFVETPRVHGYYVQQGSDTLVITFNTRILDGGIPRMGWGELRLGKMGYDVFALIDLQALWYPADDIRVMTEFIKPHLSRYKEVVTYGFSMGAYAALKYSNAFAASRTYAFSPQYSIRPEDVASFDQRRPREFYNAEYHRDMPIRRGDVCPQAFVVYDPFFDIDRNHARLIADNSDVHEVYANFLGHYSIKVLTESGSSKDLLDLLRAGTEDSRKALRGKIRHARRRSFSYMKEAAQYMAAKGERRARWALYFARQAVDLAPHDPMNRSLLVDLMLAGDRGDTAADGVQGTASLWQRLRSKLGKATPTPTPAPAPESAQSRKARVLRGLADGNAFFLADMAAYCAQLGNLDEARAVAREAAEAAIDDPQYWGTLARTVQQMGTSMEDLQLALRLADRSQETGRNTGPLRQLAAELRLAATGTVDLTAALFRAGKGARSGRGQLVADLTQSCLIVRDGPRIPIPPGAYAASLDMRVFRGIAGPLDLELEVEIGTSDVLGPSVIATGAATPIAAHKITMSRLGDDDQLAGPAIEFNVKRPMQAIRFAIKIVGPISKKGSVSFAGMTLTKSAD